MVDHSTYTSKGAYFLFMNHPSDGHTEYIDSLTMRAVAGKKWEHHDSCIRFAYQQKGNATLKLVIASENEVISKQFLADAPVLWTPKLYNFCIF